MPRARTLLFRQRPDTSESLAELCRMLNFLASVMRVFYKEIDRKNRIFDRKTDILGK